MQLNLTSFQDLDIVLVFVRMCTVRIVRMKGPSQFSTQVLAAMSIEFPVFRDLPPRS